MILKKLGPLSGREQKQLQQLTAACDGYEPYYCLRRFPLPSPQDDDLLQIAAYDGDCMAGFLSCLEAVEDADNPAPPISGADSGLLLHALWEHCGEVTAVIEPAYRKTALFELLLHKFRCHAYHKTYVISAQSLRYAGETPAFYPFAYAELLLRLGACDLRRLSALPETKGLQERYEYGFSDDQSEFLMYEQNGAEPVAVCCLAYEKSYVNLYGVFVDERLRGQGVGTFFLKQLIAKHFQDSSLPLVLNVRSTNTAAVKLYQKCGFQETERVDYYILHLED